jgi:tetratricopeptide (TPR) repeat protein
MRLIVLAGALLAAAGTAPPALAQQSLQRDATTCSTESSPADAAIAACTRLIASRKLAGAQLATIHFWRAVHANRKGDYVRVIEDASASLKIKPSQVELLNLRGSAFYDRGEYDIAIADFNDALRIGPPHSIIFHNRANAHRSKGDYARAVDDYSQAIKLAPNDAPFAYQNRGVSRQALGDLDGALADINEAIRGNPRMPSAYLSRSTLWRAKGDYDRAIADDDEALRLVRSGAPVPTLTPPGSLLIKGHVTRGLAYEAKGDFERARADFNAALGLGAADAASRASLATARARLAVLSGDDGAAPPRRTDAGSERRIALIIGNGAYGSVSPLPNPSNDARTVAKGLRDIGFDVSEGIDLDRAAMERLLRGFMRSAVTAQVAVIFYAGHGVQIDGKNYLLPVDVRADTVQSLIAGMTDVDMLLAGLDGQIRTNIIILDACRDNPLEQRSAAAGGGGRSVGVRPGLAAPGSLGAGETRGAGTLIAFATAPGQVALDGEGVNSPFSTALVRHLGTPGLEVQQMLTRVRADVVASTRSKQVPWSNSSLLGEVFLAGKP